MLARRLDVSSTHDVRHASSRPKPPRTAPPPSADAGDPSIVIAIGDVSVGQVVHQALAAIAAHTVLVPSATDALRELEGLHPALLIVDDELPLIRGLDLAGRVRSTRPDVEIILLTDDEL